MIKIKIISDAFLNIIASVIPIFILQVIALPIVGKFLGELEYGIAITLISMSTLFSLSFGNVLNNVRLLMNEEYIRNNVNGDFKILLLNSLTINTIIILIGSIFIDGQFSFLSIFFVLLFSGLNLLREYLIVDFRIKINYKAILINNVILGFGYLFGLLLFYLWGYWQLIYLTGSIFSVIYIIKNSNLIKESFRITKLFNKTIYKSIVLFFSVFMKTLLQYADKLLLFPLLGPVSVTVYYSATLMGKIVSMIVTPVSNVILSHLTKVEKIKSRDFRNIIFITVIIGTIGYFVIVLISEPILYFLYPDWASKSLNLVHITTATATVEVISSVIHPFLLRFNNINWQLIINSVNLIIYVICVFTFYNLFGLTGFCLGMLISSVVKLVIMNMVFISSLKFNN